MSPQSSEPRDEVDTTGPAGTGNLARHFCRPDDALSAVVAGQQTFTYGRLRSEAARWCHQLASHGVEPGARVAIVAGNSADMVIPHLAALALGAVSVPLNPHAPAAELAAQLEVVEPSAVVVEEVFEQTWAAVASRSPSLADRRVDSPGSAETESSSDPTPFAVASVDGDSPAVLVFSSGTAGGPKPVILTHRNLESSLEAVLSLPVDLMSQPQVFLGVIPMFHIFGLNMMLHLGMVLGATLVLEEFSGAEATLDLIGRHQATVVAGPPALWQQLMYAGAQAHHFNSVRYAVSGAAALPGALADRIYDQLGVALHDGYGLTESAGTGATTLGLENPPLGSIGNPVPGIEARLVDEAGRECVIGDPGELWLRGPMVSPGYWGETESIARTEDGWLRTGDLAVADENGCLAIVGRRKELIIVSGFNVFPGEVEAALLRHDDVLQVGVVGEPSLATGEAVVAFVVPMPDRRVDEAELWAHCEKLLSRYKVPHRFVIADTLPLGPTGKLRRRQLADDLTSR